MKERYGEGERCGGGGDIMRVLGIKCVRSGVGCAGWSGCVFLLFFFPNNFYLL